ncbi:Uncharacterised protein [Mycobacteroides abscessus subsp. massiliense]|nr:Uncharacterised protein [Mycobacteroides abscessus subsp. massiliense]
MAPRDSCVERDPTATMRGSSHFRLAGCWDHMGTPDRLIGRLTWRFAGVKGPISIIPADVDGVADAVPRHPLRGHEPSPPGRTQPKRPFLTSVKLWRKAPSQPRSPPGPSKASLKMGCTAGGRSRTAAHRSAHCGGALHSQRIRGSEFASATNFDTVHIKSASTPWWDSANTSR